MRDRGKGLSPELCELTPVSLTRLGVGVRGMYERLRQLGGVLSITSDSHGTIVKASVPIGQDRSLTSRATERLPHAG